MPLIDGYINFKNDQIDTIVEQIIWDKPSKKCR